MLACDVADSRDQFAFLGSIDRPVPRRKGPWRRSRQQRVFIGSRLGTTELRRRRCRLQLYHAIPQACAVRQQNRIVWSKLRRIVRGWSLRNRNCKTQNYEEQSNQV